MKRSILIILLVMTVTCMYSQSKLLGAGKGTKIGGNSSTPVKSETPKKSSGTVAKSTVKTAKRSSSSSTYNKPVKRASEDVNERYASQGYMEITGISFANIDKEGDIIDDYGSNLYAEEIKYLKPRIFYKGLSSADKDISVDVKIIKEDGTLDRGSSSPEGYTYSSSITVESGVGQTANLSGWGRNSGGAYEAGQYKFEIWYKGNMLYQKGIRLYSGSTPIATSKILKINNVTFLNENKDGDNITSGEHLYAGEVQYLAPKLYYNGLYSNSREVTIYYRIFDPDGSLITGTNSPVGFSTSSKVTIKSGSNSVVLSGWGNASGGAYKKSGTYKLEFWLDGELIYKASVGIDKKAGEVSYLTVDSKTAVTTSFGSSGGNETFYVRTDADSWKTWGIPSWCEVTSQTSTSFTLSCKRNYTGNTRKDYMKIMAGSKEVRIDITQY